MTENRFTGVNHDYIRDDSHAFILREPSRCIDCGRCAQVCSEVVGAACYDFMRIGFDTLVTTPLDMSLNDTPCVSCGRCAETCPTGALMPKPRVLQKYEVDESRCILCGICVDACPYDALRDGGDFELSHTSRVDPMVDLIALAAVDQETEMTYIRRERDWAERAAADGRPVAPTRLLPMLPAVGRGPDRPRRRRTATATATANGNGHVPALTAGSRAGPLPATTPATGTAERAARGDRPTIPFIGHPLGRRPVRPPRRDDARASGLAVVTMRDIIRCGLAMMVCFGALAGIYVMAGAPLVAAAQVLVYIGAISVLVLFAIMLTQTKSAPARLVFQTQAVPAAVAAVVLRRRPRSWRSAPRTWGGAAERGRRRTPRTWRRPSSATGSCRSRSSACSCSPR